ncbi:ParB/Srx family N-terminal domain-containing protein [Sphingomonas sp.]|uniref:ParB/Srx family N-terminal domain-containing protein n=1 Tax=Sphingomonas sp. TaxID=28214 RepID=UPI0025F8673B|nr:ParB/Srx family N-terminal domain-containing protein [Sphingomonas sp.]
MSALFPSPMLPNRQFGIGYISIEQLKTHPDNPRRHPASQIKALSASIRAFGFNVPVLIDGGYCIIAGDARVQATRKLGLKELPTICIDHLDEHAVRAFKIAENRLSELSSWDDQLLGAVLRDLSELNLDFDIEATGFAMAEIDLRIEGLDSPVEEAGDILSAAGPSVVQPGELWQLGDHSLVCGSALDPLSWTLLMGDALAITDPPYNVRIDGHVSGLGQHRHREFAMASGEMSEAEFIIFLETAARHMRDWSVPGALVVTGPH